MINIIKQYLILYSIIDRLEAIEFVQCVMSKIYDFKRHLLNSFKLSEKTIKSCLL